MDGHRDDGGIQYHQQVGQQQEAGEKLHMDKWDQLARPPKDALKEIRGGRLSGMTDINPQWRYKAMRDAYGPCGIGWKYEVEKMWTEQGSDGQVFQFAKVLVSIKTNDSWSAEIPGVGGSMLIEKDRNGLHQNDEAVKMSITDALSVALKMLGVGADIYMGRWDGSKYKGDVPLPASVKASRDENANKLEDWHIAVMDGFKESNAIGMEKYAKAKAAMTSAEINTFWGMFDLETRANIRKLGTG